MKKILFLSLVTCLPLLAQQTDSTIVFESPNKKINAPVKDAAQIAIRAVEKMKSEGVEKHLYKI